MATLCNQAAGSASQYLQPMRDEVGKGLGMGSCHAHVQQRGDNSD
jgi:hypothetical protein